MWNKNEKSMRIRMLEVHLELGTWKREPPLKAFSNLYQLNSQRTSQDWDGQQSNWLAWAPNQVPGSPRTPSSLILPGWLDEKQEGKEEERKASLGGQIKQVTGVKVSCFIRASSREAAHLSLLSFFHSPLFKCARVAHCLALCNIRPLVDCGSKEKRGRADTQ